MTAPQQAGGPRVRFFYADPLAAAWMGKQFEMRFERQDDWEEPFIEITQEDILDSIYETNPARCYVHPDSLMLMEPRSGDVVKLQRGGMVYYGHVWKREGSGVWISDSYWNAEGAKILNRKLIPFHMPESEPA